MENGEIKGKRKMQLFLEAFKLDVEMLSTDVEKYLKSKTLHELKTLKYELYAVITRIISLEFKLFALSF